MSNVTVSSAAVPVVLRPGQARRSYQNLGPGTSAQCLLTADDTGGAFTLIDAMFGPGAFVPLHVHTNEDEIFYILEGQWEIQVGDTILEAGPGACINGKRGIPHSPRNAGDTPGRMLVASTPGGFEQFFDKLEEFGGAPAEPTPAAIGHFLALLKDFGMTGLPPAGAVLSRQTAPVQINGVPTDLGDHRVWPLLSSSESNTDMLMVYVDADPGAGVPPHIHSREDETFYVLSGTFAIEVNGRTWELGPGDVGVAPRYLPHSWQCVGMEPGRAIAIVTPGSNFEAFAETMTKAQITPSSPENIAMLIGMAQAHGIEMLPPGK